MPGLADLHVHLMGGWDGVTVDMLGFPVMLNALLYAGVTTVLDVGNVSPYIQQIRQETEAGRLTGPRIKMVASLIDGPTPVWPPISLALSSVDQIKGFITQLAAARVDLVKAYGGLSNEQLKAVVDGAREASLRVVADVGRRNGTLAAAETGIAAFAHAGGAPITDETVAFQKANGVATITTLVVVETRTRRRLGDLRFLDHPLLAHTMPPVYRDQLRAFANRPRSGQDSAGSRTADTRLGVAMANVKKLIDAGVLVAAGTDAPYPGSFFGENLHRELELLVEAGLTPLQAITVATRNAAALLREENLWGTLEPGRRADVLIVRGDPSSRISDTRNVETVIQAGRILDRARLRYNPATAPGYHPAGSASGH
jgi:imidazolonepropionase-like amidohydrolase